MSTGLETPTEPSNTSASEVQQSPRYPIYLPPNPQVDFLSPNFNAFVALTTLNVPVPCVVVKPKDSIMQCRHFLQSDDPDYRPPPPQSQPSADGSILKPTPKPQTGVEVDAKDKIEEKIKGCPMYDGLTTDVAYFPGIQPRGTIAGAPAVPGPTALLSRYMDQIITVALQGPMPSAIIGQHSTSNRQSGPSRVHDWTWGCTALVRGTLTAHDAFGNVLLKNAVEVRWVSGMSNHSQIGGQSRIVGSNLENSIQPGGNMTTQEAEALLFGARQQTTTTFMTTTQASPTPTQPSPAAESHWAASLTGVRARLYKKQQDRNKHDFGNIEEDMAEPTNIDHEEDKETVPDRFLTLSELSEEDGLLNESQLKSILQESLASLDELKADKLPTTTGGSLPSCSLWAQRVRNVETLYIPNQIIVLITDDPSTGCGSGLRLPWHKQADFCQTIE